MDAHRRRKEVSQRLLVSASCRASRVERGAVLGLDDRGHVRSPLYSMAQNVKDVQTGRQDGIVSADDAKDRGLMPAVEGRTSAHLRTPGKPLAGLTIALPEARESKRLASLLELKGATTLRVPLVGM